MQHKAAKARQEVCGPQTQMGPQLTKHAPIDGMPWCLLHGGLQRLCKKEGSSSQGCKALAHLVLKGITMRCKPNRAPCCRHVSPHGPCLTCVKPAEAQLAGQPLCHHVTQEARLAGGLHGVLGKARGNGKWSRTSY